MKSAKLLVSGLFIISLIFVCLISSTQGKTRNRIKLRDVKVMTLTHGQLTTGRRTRPAPQLQCIGGSNRCKFLPPVIQCYNRGTDGVDIQWECKADMDQNLRFNKIEVTCEGYDFPEDDYVLVGSCGLEYSIDSVDGKLHPETTHSFNPPPKQHYHQQQQSSSGSNFNQRTKPYRDPDAGFVIILAIIAGTMYLIWKHCIEAGSTRRHQQPPPPYPGRDTPSAPAPPPPPPGFKTDYTRMYPDVDNSGDSTTSSTPHSRERLGFWSGLSLGSLAGYFFGNRRQPTVTRTESPSSRGSSWSSWFSPRTSSGTGSTTRRRYRERTPSPEPTTFSSQSSPSSSGTKTASGFGGTSRR